MNLDWALPRNPKTPKTGSVGARCSRPVFSTQ
jgi:hypothetical protein